LIPEKVSLKCWLRCSDEGQPNSCGERKDGKIVHKRMIGLAFCIAAFAVSGVAQTNTFPASGNVGIGATTPGGKLEIVQDGGAGGLTNTTPAVRITGSAGDMVNYHLDILPEVPTGGSEVDYEFSIKNISATTIPLYLQGSTGNVGIGTTSPTAPLTIWGPNLGTVSGNTANLLSLDNGNGNGSYLNVFQLRNSNGTDWTTSTTRIRQVIDATGQGYIDFNPPNGMYGIAFGSGICCGSTSIAVEYMRIASGGNVGIGTTTPGAKLEVDGNVKLTSGSGASITFQDGTVQSTAYTGVTCGGDYAESVDVTGSRTSYEPGDVLVLDANNPGKVLKSVEAYSTSVSGIYSTKPGTVGRRQTTDPKTSASEVPMAMVGIVPAKVSAENGSIKVGDLLVSSSTAGYAMKGTDRGRMLGAVIGKAMGNLNSGKGVIEILVTLQ
jgi:hypothetical protein